MLKKRLFHANEENQYLALFDCFRCRKWAIKIFLLKIGLCSVQRSFSKLTLSIYCHKLPGNHFFVKFHQSLFIECQQETFFLSISPNFCNFQKIL